MKRLVVLLLVSLTILILPGAIDKHAARQQILSQFRSESQANPGASAQALRPSLPGERFISVPGSAFQYAYAGGPYDSSNVTPGTLGEVGIWNGVIAVAPLQLPEGARISYFAAHMGNTNPNWAARLSLARIKRDGTTTRLYYINTAPKFRLLEKRLGTQRIVDNRTGAYYLRAEGVAGELDLFLIGYVIIGYIPQ